MTPQLQDKLRKISELVQRGATEGERAAAKTALDRIIEKYQIDESELLNLSKKRYYFKFSMNIEKKLFAAIVRVLVDSSEQLFSSNIDGATRINAIGCDMEYEDWVVVVCAWEYFKPHMKKQYSSTVLKELNRCRTTKTRSLRRKELEPFFISKYLIQSQLFRPNQIKRVELKGREARNAGVVDGVEGGSFNKQMDSGLYLN